jgi:1-acyl-sn-glycerol-3-phosphate acyltransferase
MEMHTKFDHIRSFYDDEVPTALASISDHPMLKPMMRFIYPESTPSQWHEKISSIRTIEDFQVNITYDALMRILQESAAGFTTSGFEKLDKNTAYLYISNHRDIILDTSLINLALHQHGLIMTASAIGDNLVKNPFLLTLAKVNRNFLVQRGLPPRELLASSKLMSEYIYTLITSENRSIWIAQRDGRTKDGNDATHPGVLKMLYMAADKTDVGTYFKQLKIVPVTVSYEQDPTDALKLPEVIAHKHHQEYIKGENEDFNSIIKGITGQKKHIHLHAGSISDLDLDDVAAAGNTSQQLKQVAQLIDREIVENFRLWPANFIAYDLRYQTEQNAMHYTPQDKEAFQLRLSQLIDINNTDYMNSLLDMYANPVRNKAMY